MYNLYGMYSGTCKGHPDSVRTDEVLRTADVLESPGRSLVRVMTAFPSYIPYDRPIIIRTFHTIRVRSNHHPYIPYDTHAIQSHPYEYHSDEYRISPATILRDVVRRTSYTVRGFGTPSVRGLGVDESKLRKMRTLTGSIHPPLR
jgi:hypothetical protein